MSRKHDEYVNKFFAYNGPGPYFCYFCNEAVYPWWQQRTIPRTRYHLSIHHLDEDHMNNHHSNLVAVHHGCHMRFHGKGRMTPERARAISKGLKIAYAEGRR